MALTNPQAPLIIINDSSERIKFDVTGTTLNTSGLNLDAPVITTNMISWWKFNNSTADFFGPHTLTAIGSPTFATVNPIEGTHYGVIGIGPNQWRIPSTGAGTEAFSLQNFTFEFWVRRTQASTGNFIAAMGTAGNSGWFWRDSAVSGRGDFAIHATPNPNPTTGVINLTGLGVVGLMPLTGDFTTWAHVVFTCNDSTKLCKMYRDATLLQTLDWSLQGNKIAYDNAAVPNSRILTIGGFVGGGLPETWHVDSVKVYSVELTQPQIQQNFNAEV